MRKRGMHRKCMSWSTTKGEWKLMNPKVSTASLCEILPLLSEVKGFSPEKGLLSLNPSRSHPNAIKFSYQHRQHHLKGNNHRCFSLTFQGDPCPRVCREQSTQAEHRKLPQMRKPVVLIIESKHGSLWVCLSCVTPKASAGHHIQPHRTGQLILLSESIHWSLYQLINSFCFHQGCEY